MIPKERARQLISRFIPLVDDWDGTNDCKKEEYEINQSAKELALVCVDEIISVLEYMGKSDVGNRWNQAWYGYVKEEIQKQ